VSLEIVHQLRRSEIFVAPGAVTKERSPGKEEHGDHPSAGNDEQVEPLISDGKEKTINRKQNKKTLK
jgi:hypothetical protein